MFKAWRIEGRVQGVGFRWFVRKHALGIGVVGTVKNLPNGAVEVECVGDPDQLQLLEAELMKGPPMSSVVEVLDVTDQHEIKSLKTFDII